MDLAADKIKLAKQLRDDPLDTKIAELMDPKM
jgi:hypothetical protein